MSFSAMPRAAVLLMLALLPPLAAAAAANHSLPGHFCGEHGKYAPNSTYEANLRFLAATLPAKVNVSSGPSSSALTAYRPDRVFAFALCHRRPDADSSECGACIALAFQDAQRLCPYHRYAMVDRGACRVSFHDYYRREQEVGAVDDGSEHTPFWRSNVLVQDFLLISVFQAIGFSFLLFLFLQEWRASKRTRHVISRHVC